MKKFTAAILNNKFLIILSALSIIAAVIENLAAYFEQFSNLKKVSMTYGILYIVMASIYVILMIYFAFTLKRRKTSEFLLAILLFCATVLTFVYFKSDIFHESNIYDFNKIVYNNPFVFKFHHYNISTANGEAIYSGMHSTYSFMTTSAIIAIILTGFNAAKSYFSKD